jgi:hypothetical protein
MSEDAFADGESAYTRGLTNPNRGNHKAWMPIAATTPFASGYPRAAVTIASTSPSSGKRPVWYLE